MKIITYSRKVESVLRGILTQNILNQTVEQHSKNTHQSRREKCNISWTERSIFGTKYM